MIIRMFEYDSQIALQNSEQTVKDLTVNFPESGILFLRHNKTTPNNMKIRINTPGGSVSYTIPVMKLGDYSAEDIIEKDLYFLIPFYLFNYEALIENDGENGKEKEEQLDRLRRDYVRIRHYLDVTCTAGKISEYEKRAILDLSKKVLNKLSGRSDMIKKEVEAIMGGKILDYEAKDILNQGISRGISLGKAEGKAEEKAETLERVTKNYMEMDPTLTVEEAREKARMILK